ncbi:MAG: hypothetical protein KQH83_11520 [Actinobacteria bacterium]|nr:hypothetical protein [Actinomycetota bacterium]
MAVRAVSGEARFTSTPFSNRWELWSEGERLATLTRHPRHHTSEAVLADGTALLLRPEGWGAVAALSDGKETARVTRRSWWGRRWEITSPLFGYDLTSDPLPRRWTIRVGDVPIARLAGGMLSYNRLAVHADLAVQVPALVLAWHVLARPWEAAAAPGSLVPGEAKARPA